MSVSIQIKLSPATVARLRQLQDWPARVAPALQEAMDLQNQFSLARISEKYVSFPRESPPTPDGVRLITGKLRQSLRATPAVASGNGVTSSIGSNRAQAYILEHGGVTRPHVIKARKAKALYFMGKTGGVFCRSVNHPGSKIAARHYVARGVTDRLAEYQTAFAQAITAASQGN